MNKSRFSGVDLCWLFLILVVFCAVSTMFVFNQKFSFDHTQMLLKGFHAAFTGEFLPFGNEASTVGNLPGKLCAFVIGFPLMLWNHAYSPMVFMIVLRVFALILFANALIQIFSSRIATIGVFLLAFTPWTFAQAQLYNPAYVMFGTALFLNMLIRLRNDRDLKTSFGARFLCTVLLVLSICFCLQLHFSWPVLCAIAGLMWLRRDIRISYIGAFVGTAITAWLLMPYVQEIMVNPTLLENPEPYAQDRYIGYGLVHVAPLFKGLFYWFRFASMMATKRIIVPDFEFDEVSLWVGLLAYFWIGIAMLIGIGTVLVSLYANYFTLCLYRVSNNVGRMHFVRGFTFSCIVSVLIVSALSPVTLNYWQIAIVVPFALIPLLTFFSSRPKIARGFVLVAVVFFFFADTLAATYSHNFDYRSNYRAEFYRTCLVGFTADQCAPYASGLTPEYAEGIRSTTHIDLATVKRVIDGIIPLAPNIDPEKRKELEHISSLFPRHYRGLLLSPELNMGPVQSSPLMVNSSPVVETNSSPLIAPQAPKATEEAKKTLQVEQVPSAVPAGTPQVAPVESEPQFKDNGHGEVGEIVLS